MMLRGKKIFEQENVWLLILHLDQESILYFARDHNY